VSPPFYVTALWVDITSSPWPFLWEPLLCEHSLTHSRATQLTLSRRMNALREFTPSELPIAGIILIEPVLFDKETSDLTPQTPQIAEIMRKSILSQKHFWPDVDSAKDYLTKRPPWSGWHPDILNTYLVRSLALIVCTSTNSLTAIDPRACLCKR
jgi:hypothetical protein